MEAERNRGEGEVGSGGSEVEIPVVVYLKLCGTCCKTERGGVGGRMKRGRVYCDRRPLEYIRF